MIRNQNAAPPRLTAEQIRTIVQEVSEVVVRIVEERVLVRERPRHPVRETACPRLEAIIAAACEASGISRELMTGPRRSRRLARPRQVAMLACANLATHASLPQIGRAFRRDHTTIMHGIRRAAELVAEHPDLRALYDAIAERVTQPAEAAA